MNNAHQPDGAVNLLAPGRSHQTPCPPWICVFDPDAGTGTMPSPIVARQIIGTDAPSISYWTLDVAPEAALSNIDAEAGLLAGMSRRLKQFWPELARTVTADVSEPSSTRTKRKNKEVRVETLEAKSAYAVLPTSP